MTTREWFRVLRGELWRQDDRLANDVDRIATTILQGHDPWRGLGWQYCGPFLVMIEDIATYERRVEAFEAVKADLDAAVRRLYSA